MQVASLKHNWHAVIPYFWINEGRDNLRSDPFERADTDANGYNNWRIDHLFLLVPTRHHVANQLATFAEYPPRQKPAKFNVEEVLSTLREAKSAN